MKEVVVIMTDRELNIIKRKLMDYIRDNPEVLRKAVEDYYNKMNFVDFRDVAVGDCAIFKAKED